MKQLLIIYVCFFFSNCFSMCCGPHLHINMREGLERVVYRPGCSNNCREVDFTNGIEAATFLLFMQKNPTLSDIVKGATGMPTIYSRWIDKLCGKPIAQTPEVVREDAFWGLLKIYAIIAPGEDAFLQDALKWIGVKYSGDPAVELECRRAFIQVSQRQVPTADEALALQLNDEVIRGAVGAVRFLLQIGADPNLLGHKETALDVWLRQSQFLKRAGEMRALLEGADAKHSAHGLGMQLHDGIMLGDVARVAALLAMGADPKVESFGRKPVDRVAARRPFKDWHDMAVLFAAHGAGSMPLLLSNKPANEQRESA